MRTTITIDDDVLDRARAVASKLNTSFRSVVNQALRMGLEQVEKPVKSRRYRTNSRAMGLNQGRNLDNIQELLAQTEREGFH
jgi:Arc/MetJ family transcription regulator